MKLRQLLPLRAATCRAGFANRSLRALLLGAIVAPSIVAAQDGPPGATAAAGARIPVRQLGPVTATSKDSMGPQVVIRGLSNGSVMVNDIARRRVLLYDPTLTKATSVVDSAGTTGSAMATQVPSSQLIRYLGDSSLYVDVATQALLVIDPSGKVAHVMALPRPTDAILIAIGALGAAVVDPKGRLVYRGQYPPKITPPDPNSGVMMSIPVSPDSGPILRADFDARKVDTVGTLKVIAPGAITMKQDGQGNVTMKIGINPLDAADEWGMLADGTIAILRAHDYHIDWIDPDGSHRTSAKMPFDWKRLSDEQKQFKVDSMKQVVEQQLASRPAVTLPTADGPRKLKTEVDFVPLNKIPDFEPPIQPGAMKADLDGNLWIVPRTSASAQGGVLYDVVNRKGDIVERVQFPKGYALAGFGPGGALYVLRVEGKTGFLGRASLGK